jgi:YfiH family protein
MMEKIPPSWLYPDWPAPANVCAASTSREGGVSRPPYDSFNLGSDGNDRASIAENRARLKSWLALPSEPIWLRQVHGARVVNAAEAAANLEADATVAFEPGVACAVLTADCLPVLFCDRNGTRVAAAHAGWRGILAGILEATVKALATASEELIAWFGPAIGATAFEVGAEVRDAFIKSDPACADAFTPSLTGSWLADIYALARIHLNAVGVTAIYGGGLCTYSDVARFFSYRRDTKTGRMTSLVWVSPAANVQRTFVYYGCTGRTPKAG